MSGPPAVPESHGPPERSGGRVPAPRTLAEVLPTAAVRQRRSPTWMLDQLPVGMLAADGGTGMPSFFVRFVSIFQNVGSTLLDDADLVEHIADVSVTPSALVRWLGSWIGDDLLEPSEDAEVDRERVERALVRAAAKSLTWRGTARGLSMVLELLTDGEVSITEGGGVWREDEAPSDTAWVTVRVDDTGWVPEADFIAVVRDEIPAHVRGQLWVGGRLAWSSEDDFDEPPPLPGNLAHQSSRRTGALPAAPEERQ